MVFGKKRDMKDTSISGKEARFWRKEGEGVRCLLCPHRCFLKDGQRGICRVRRNVGGVLITENYGFVSSISPDPIEKKPLFHFHPSEIALSFGTVGCNLRCKHCQNWEISQVGVGEFPSFYSSYYTPQEIADFVISRGYKIVAWTYNEPIIWFEFVVDTSKLLKEMGIKVVYVTNGFANENAWREMLKYADAMNIDVKAMSEEFYRKITLGSLKPVLRNVEIAKEMNKHVELTYLIIPELNDSDEELRKFASWVKNLDESIPVHFSRFFPHYNMRHKPPTPIETMYRAYNIAKEEGLKYVYLGNVWDERYESTYCPRCNSLLIRRTYYDVELVNLDRERGVCKKCGEKIEVVLK